ncbi:MAG: tetratricopeptide repeat protein [Gammaproteobacteria bacterium]
MRAAPHTILTFICVSVSAYVLGAACVPGAASAAQPHVDDFVACGKKREIKTGGNYGLTDYRLREISSATKRALADLDSHHTNPAVEAMFRGAYGGEVKADLNFTLVHSPNHHRALQALVQYDRAGGKAGGFPATECYFHWAQVFAPDDSRVWMIGGYYFWTKGDRSRAETWYRQALQFDPEYADAHYNLGLLYFELADFERSLEHARAAYEAGYPLVGLRNKLERSGHWQASPPPAPLQSAENPRDNGR